MSSSSSSHRKGGESDITIPLREWIKHALYAADVSSVFNDTFAASFEGENSAVKREAVLSDDFLIPALNIAHALASQVCRAKSHSAASDCDKGEKCSLFLPSPGSDWTGQIVVHLQTDSIENENEGEANASFMNDTDLEPLSFSSDPPESDPTELQVVIGVINSDLFSSDQDEKTVEQSDSARDVDAYREMMNSVGSDERSGGNDHSWNLHSWLDVESAEILPLTDCGDGSDLTNEISLIHSIGLVFYELFSGGMKPPGLNEVEIKSSCDERYEPLAYQQSHAIDLAGALRILDELGCEDERCGDPMGGNKFGVVRTQKTKTDDCVDIPSALQILDELGGSDELFGSSDEGKITDEREYRRKKASANIISTKEKNSEFDISVERLRVKGLPGPLFDLIANMIDCANGDLRGDESYSHISDVQSDLKLMMNNPNKFLRGVDVATLSKTGLQIDESSFFSRQAELTTLHETYKRSISGESELAIITGPSGSGKSVLANQLGRIAKMNGGIFLSAKFDQLAQAKPFSAIASAFDEYCNMVKDSDKANEIACELRSSLGQGVFSLIKVIPNLATILGEECTEYSTSDQEYCVNPQKRLQYLWCRFVAVLANSSETPVTLFLDDLQWADPASVEVINRIMMTHGTSAQPRHFFFLGSCRDNEMIDSHPVWTMISGVGRFDVRTTIIELSCFDRRSINKMVSHLLCLSPRLTLPLSDIIFHKTKGNPLFFFQLLLSLNKEGLLRLSLSRRRWEWDDERIRSRKIPDNVAMFFSNTISKLPKEVQSALCTLSFFGCSAEFSVMSIMEKERGTQLLGPLDDAVAEGLLDKTNGKYCFVHDRIQEAAYHVIEPEERPLRHFEYGIILSTYSLRAGDDNMLFTAVGQINRGGPSAVADNDRGITMANINHVAGTKAISMSDFTSAFHFFDNGISFLPDNHWSENYDLSLKLFEAAAKSALVTANFSKLKYYSDQVMDHAMTSEDKLNTLYVGMSALAYTSQLPESVEVGMSVLGQLGEGLPAHPSSSQLDFHCKQTKMMLSDLADEDLIDYKVMNDSSKLMAMKFLARLQTSMLMLRPDVQPFVTLKMVQLSLVYGMSPASPTGFAYYGALLGKLGDVEAGYRFAKIAKNLIGKPGFKEVAGEVFVISTQVLFYVEPMQVACEYFLEGRSIAMSAGDTNHAMLNTLFFVLIQFYMGKKLAISKENFSNARLFFKKHDHLQWIGQLVPLERTILTLTGSSDNLAELALFGQNPHQSMVVYFQKMYASFIFRRHDEMKGFAEIFFECRVKFPILYLIQDMHTFISGLVSFWVYRKSNDKKWLDRGIQSVSELRNSSASSKWNFQNKVYLMEAEEHFCNKDYECAKSSYEKAILSAREHKFIHEEALAYELAGEFFMECARKYLAVKYLMKAREKYDEWGAFFKASVLRNRIDRLLDGNLQDMNILLTSNTCPLSMNEQQYDLTATNPRKRATLSLCDFTSQYTHNSSHH